MSTPNASGSKIPGKFLNENIVQDDHAPLWAYVTIVDKGKGGGNKTWSCNFCEKAFTSSYSRVKGHLLRVYGTGIAVCPSVNEEYLAELKSVVELAENRVKPKHVPLPTQTTQDNASLKRRKCSPLERAFNLEDRDHLRALIARKYPHEDEEISTERNKCLKKFFTTSEDSKRVALEFADFSSKAHAFASYDSIEDRWTLDPKSWWVMHGSSAPLLQKLALKLLVQPTSSSCCERNWSTYSFIHSLKRNKLNPKRAEDLVYVHTNLRLLSRKNEEYNEGSTKMWDISGDAWDDFDGVGTLEVASLSIDEPDMEAVLFSDDGQGGDEIATIPIS